MEVGLKRMLGKGGITQNNCSTKCIQAIDNSTNNFITMPNVPGECVSALERSTFQLAIYQTALTQTQ